MIRVKIIESEALKARGRPAVRNFFLGGSGERTLAEGFDKRKNIYFDSSFSVKHPLLSNFRGGTDPKDHAPGY